MLRTIGLILLSFCAMGCQTLFILALNSNSFLLLSGLNRMTLTLDSTDPVWKLVEGDQRARQEPKGPKTTMDVTVRVSKDPMFIQARDLTAKRSMNRTRISIIPTSSRPLDSGPIPHKSGGTLAHLFSPEETGAGTVWTDFRFCLCHFEPPLRYDQRLHKNISETANDSKWMS